MALLLVMASLFLFIALGTPIFLSLGLSGLIGIYIIMGARGFFQLPSSIFAQLNSFILVAIPLYILMGELIFVTGIGKDIFYVSSRWLNEIPGGLAIATIYSSAIFGAVCGVSIAGVAAIGTIALPEMLDRGYDKSLAAGAIAASGALAVLIPPSISFILYGSLSSVSVAKLFIGGIIPGLTLATMMALYVLIRVKINPKLAPKEFSFVTWKERIAPLAKLWPVILLILLILGTIYSGICTPTESGAIGVAGALLITIVNRRLNWNTLRSAVSKAARISASLLIILACAYTFSQFLNLIRLPEKVANWAISLDVPGIIVVLISMLLLVILGCLIDGASLIIVTTPILLPTIMALGFDPLWYGILMVLNVEIAVITPPVGLNLYTLQSITDRVSLGEILRGTAPYILIDFLCLLLFMLVPTLALWLPSTM